MFCVSCGNPVFENQNFCRVCGQAVVRLPTGAPAAPAPEAQPTPAQPSPAPPPGPPAGHCAWCNGDVTAGEISCHHCGAALGRPPAGSQSGWIKLPARKDMAKLQIGNSSCQIEGLYVPVADVNLAPGDGVYFTHHVLLWKDPGVNVTTMSMKGAWKRLFAGLPLIMTQAAGPGHIAFSKDDPGELIPVPMQPGHSIDVREHLLLAATLSVQYDWFQTGIWFETKDGDETETHYPIGQFMDRFSAPSTPGLLLLHAGGNVFVRRLEPGQTILVKPSALVFKDPTVQMQLHFEHPGGSFSLWRPWGNRYLWLRLTGPGRIAIQSVFERLEGESRNMTRWSNATATSW